MLHLSFTQQLCHLAKIKPNEAANDAVFGLPTDLQTDHAHNAASMQSPQHESGAASSVLKQLAERYLKK